MRFIHVADIHFDAPFTFLADKENYGEKRRVEQRQAFRKMIEYIEKEKIEYLFIAGDLYEQNYIQEATIEYINNLFKNIPNTKIFISPGNHDPKLKNSYYNNFKWNENVYIFNSEMEIFEFDDVDIYGYGFDDFYFEKNKIENIEIKNKNKINILITHADVDASSTSEMIYNPIKKNKLKEKGFDYIALGHVHKRQIIDENIVYAGSFISLGFDELGEHGMLDVKLDKKELEMKFIKLDNREFKESKIDITNINTKEELIEKLNNLEIPENMMYKIILEGTRNFEIETSKILKLIEQKNILKIKNNTKIKYDLETLSKQNNLKGIFISEMLDLLNNENIDKEIVEKAIEIGLNNI